jgi:hypothetical protein
VALFFVWLQNELEQSGSILCLVEESTYAQRRESEARASPERSGSVRSIFWSGLVWHLQK